MAKETRDYLTILEEADADNLVILDTETTGLGESAEIVELAIIEAKTGKPLLHTRIKPSWTESWPHAEKIHGISPAAVDNCPTLCEYMPHIRSILFGKTVAIFNEKYDTMLFPDRLHTVKDKTCIMTIYKEQYALKKGFNLVAAAEMAGHDWGEGSNHSALDDCLATRSVLFHVLQKAQDMRKALEGL